MNRCLPVLWWQRPQYWSRFSEDDNGQVMPLDTALRAIQPKE